MAARNLRAPSRWPRSLACQSRSSANLEIALNLNPLRALDPFLTSHKATQALPEEEFSVEGEAVKAAPFILPHLSKLSASYLQVAGGEDGLRRNQGFYVYRNERLITRGWFHRTCGGCWRCLEKDLKKRLRDIGNMVGGVARSNRATSRRWVTVREIGGDCGDGSAGGGARDRTLGSVALRKGSCADPARTFRCPL